MEFIDNKEEVIHFELTPYGRRQFASGKLKPTYYAFSDNDILYDIGFSGDSEQQNSGIPRIYDETPRLSQNLGKMGTIEKEDTLSGSYRQREYINLLGNLEPYSTESSNINFVQLDGTLSSVTTKQQGYYEVTSSIQYEVKINPVSRYKNDKDFSIQSDSEDVSQDVVYFKDGSNIETVQDFFILKLEEENAHFSRQNYDIKIFDLDEGKYIDFEENGQIDIFLDYEISSEIMCPLISIEKRKDIFQDKLFECQDRKERRQTNIYNNLKDFKGIC